MFSNDCISYCVLFLIIISFSSDYQQIYCYYFLHRIVIGYDEGTIMVKIGREEPVASMDNSGKIIWAKHNEIQTVNIKSVGADYEVWAQTNYLVCGRTVYLR